MVVRKQLKDIMYSCSTNIDLSKNLQLVRFLLLPLSDSLNGNISLGFHVV